VLVDWLPDKPPAEFPVDGETVELAELFPRGLLDTDVEEIKPGFPLVTPFVLALGEMAVDFVPRELATEEEVHGSTLPPFKIVVVDDNMLPLESS
jgi:hypothetical protein